MSASPTIQQLTETLNTFGTHHPGDEIPPNEPTLTRCPALPSASPPPRKDDLGAFEACLSFFLHWGSRLLVTFPQPPVPILAGMELSLARADRELAAHLASLEVGALSYGWPLLRTAFSEVLDRENWLRLIDRILVNAERPELLEAAAVGFAVASRTELLALESTQEAEAFFRRRQASSVFDLERMLRVMEKVSRFGPPEKWRGQGHVVGGMGGEDASETMAALALLRSAPREFKPLPKLGAYPFYDGYPQFVVNYQAEMRQRVVQQHDNGRKGRLVSGGGLEGLRCCGENMVVADIASN